MQNQILRNQKKFFFHYLKHTPKIDSGPLYSQDYFYLDGSELYDEIRLKQAQVVLRIMVKYLKFPNLKQLKQSKKSSYNKKELKNSELNLNKP